MLKLNRDRCIPFYSRMNLAASPANDGRSYWVIWKRHSAANSRLLFPRNCSVHLELNAKAYFVLVSLAKAERLSPRTLCRSYNEKFPTSELRYEEVVEAVSLLYYQGFLVPNEEARKLGFQVIEPEPEGRSLPIWRKLLSLRLPLVNPDRFLTWVDDKAGDFLFSAKFNRVVMLWVAFILIAVLSQIDRLHDEWGMLYEYYLPTHIVTVYCWLFLGKLLHEL